jgi:hypothetical protein
MIHSSERNASARTWTNTERILITRGTKVATHAHLIGVSR